MDAVEDDDDDDADIVEKFEDGGDVNMVENACVVGNCGEKVSFKLCGTEYKVLDRLYVGLVLFGKEKETTFEDAMVELGVRMCVSRGVSIVSRETFATCVSSFSSFMTFTISYFEIRTKGVFVVVDR